MLHIQAKRYQPINSDDSIFNLSLNVLNPGHSKGARFFGRAISEISGR